MTAAEFCFVTRLPRPPNEKGLPVLPNALTLDVIAAAGKALKLKDNWPNIDCALVAAAAVKGFEG